MWYLFTYGPYPNCNCTFGRLKFVNYRRLFVCSIVLVLAANTNYRSKKVPVSTDGFSPKWAVCCVGENGFFNYMFTFLVGFDGSYHDEWMSDKSPSMQFGNMFSYSNATLDDGSWRTKMDEKWLCTRKEVFFLLVYS